MIAFARSRARGVDHFLLSKVALQRRGPSLRDSCWNRRTECVRTRRAAWFIMAVCVGITMHAATEISNFSAGSGTTWRRLSERCPGPGCPNRRPADPSPKAGRQHRPPSYRGDLPPRPEPTQLSQLLDSSRLSISIGRTKTGPERFVQRVVTFSSLK